MTRKAITAQDGVAIGPYSHGIEAGEFIYLSGQTPLDPETGKLVRGDAGDQTRQCLANLTAVLQAAGLDLDDAVKVNVFLTDMDDFEAMNAAYATLFNAPYPARTTVAVKALPLAAQVEIELVARKR